MHGLNDEFSDPKFIARVILNNNIRSGIELPDLLNDPEFRVLKIIGQTGKISTEDLETKFESLQSMSMILSNIQADGLIYQTNEYKWVISEQFTKYIQDEINSLSIATKTSPDKASDNKIEIKELKKDIYKKIADQLVGTNYIPSFFTIEDLFEIPEIEILVLIHDNGPIDALALEEILTLETSLSLGLSNLQADGYIESLPPTYKWQLVNEFNAKINSMEINSLKSEKIEESSDSISLISNNQARIIEHKQLIQALLDQKYFTNKTVSEIIQTADFEILNIINSNSPIFSEKIQENLTQETSLSLFLSNLKADGLVEQLNDYRWTLSEEFNIRVSKVIVSKQEIMDHVRREELFEKTTLENIDKPTTGKDLSPTIITSKENQNIEPNKSVDPFISNLVQLGYLVNSNLSQEELFLIPEYQILQIIKNQQPITGEEITEITDIASVSLSLSNLSADGLIRQTNDYEYVLIDYDEGDNREINISEKISQPKSSFSVVVDPSQTLFKQDFDVEKLIGGVYKAGYINKKEVKVEILMKVPEFEVLKIIGEMNPITENDLKMKTKSVSPVLISRTLSKLEADLRITRNPNEEWIYTKEFEDLLVEDEIKKQEFLKKIEANKREEEKKRKFEEERELKEKFVDFLRKEGAIVEGETDLEKLMMIPDFEVLWIINKYGSITEAKIKEKAESVSPVLVGRTINKLESIGRIARTLNGEYKLT